MKKYVVYWLSVTVLEQSYAEAKCAAPCKMRRMYLSAYPRVGPCSIRLTNKSRQGRVRSAHVIMLHSIIIYLSRTVL